jgi:hypothetical protein
VNSLENILQVVKRHYNPQYYKYFIPSSSVVKFHLCPAVFLGGHPFRLFFLKTTIHTFVVDPEIDKKNNENKTFFRHSYDKVNIGGRNILSRKYGHETGSCYDQLWL